MSKTPSQVTIERAHHGYFGGQLVEVVLCLAEEARDCVEAIVVLCQTRLPLLTQGSKQARVSHTHALTQQQRVR